MLFGNSIDANHYQILNPRLHILSSDPGSPLEGEYWYDSTAHQFKYRDNSATRVISAGGGITNGYATITDGSTAASASGADTFKLRAAGTGLTVATQNNDVTHGDNALYTIDSATSGNNKLLLTGAGGKILAVVIQEVIATTDLTDVTAVTGSGTTIVFNNSPTIVTPTIASFVNANHSHADAAGGGTLTHLAISDFDTQVRTSTLNQMTAPTADLSINSHKLTNVTDPTGPQDAATKLYVDTNVQGLKQKPTATVATTAALPASTYSNGASGVGATLTGNSNGALTVDSFAVAAGNRVLVKDQASGFQNGLYDVTQPGTGGTPFILTRNIDMDTTTEFAGSFIPVEDAGTANANSLWLVTNTADPTVGTTAITFVQLNKGTDLAAGTGITISGNSVSVATTYAGGTSIASLGTVTVGVWQGTIIGLLYGGTGVDASTGSGAATARDTSHLGKQATAAANATNVVAANAGIPTKTTFTLTHNGSATSFTCTHNLNTRDVCIQIRDASHNGVIVNWVCTDANTVTVTWDTAQANTTVFYVVIIG